MSDMSLDTAELRRIAAAKRRLHRNVSEVSEIFVEQSSEIADTMRDLGGVARHARETTDTVRRIIREHPLMAIGVAFAAGWLVSTTRTRLRQPEREASMTGSLAGLAVQGLMGLAPAILDMVMTEVLTQQRRPDTV